MTARVREGATDDGAPPQRDAVERGSMPSRTATPRPALRAAPRAAPMAAPRAAPAKRAVRGGPSAAPHEPRLARVAALVADASRSRMLSYLLGGEFASASELAQAASISAATASGHLAQLLDAGLVACEPRGRHRYYRLADGDVAHALEALAMVAERTSHARQWTHPSRERLRFARCCYGHLAGQLGVAVFDGLREQGWLQPREQGGFAVSASGAEALTSLGLDGAAWHRRSQAAGTGAARVAYGCIDWSERRDHLAGPLAVALLALFTERGWLRRQPGDRALQCTPAGRQALGGWVRLPPA